jgi:uncharacterized protein YciI
MKHFLLFYDLAPTYLDQRGHYRAEHLGLAWRMADAGHLLVAGALANPADGAVYLFQGETDAQARAFAEADPYVANGLVTAWRVREWTTAAGPLAANPVRP